MDLHERIEHDLTNHPPTPEQQERIESVRVLGKELAHHLVHTCQPGRELSVALSGVEQAVMFGVAAIAREVPPPRTWTDEERRLIETCQSSAYHETHRYCPACPWTEDFA